MQGSATTEPKAQKSLGARPRLIKTPRLITAKALTFCAFWRGLALFPCMPLPLCPCLLAFPLACPCICLHRLFPFCIRLHRIAASMPAFSLPAVSGCRVSGCRVSGCRVLPCLPACLPWRLLERARDGGWWLHTQMQTPPPPRARNKLNVSV